MSGKKLIEITSRQCKLSKGEHMEGNILLSSLWVIRVPKQSSFVFSVREFYWKQMVCDLNLPCYAGYIFLS